MPTPRGKIGRLSDAQRARINGLIRDNKTADEIIAVCAASGLPGVTPQNVSAWKRFGYEKWLKDQQRLDAMAARREFSRTLINEALEEGGDALALASDAASAMAVDQISDALEEFDTGALKAMLHEKPENFAVLISALAKLRARDQAGVLLRQKIDAARIVAGKARAAAEKTGDAALKLLADEMDAALGS